VIEHVSGVDDPRLAGYAHVGDPVWLRSNGLFVAEGRFVVRRLLEADRFDVESIVVIPSALDGMSDVLERAPCPVFVAHRPALAALTGFDFHRGCLALARRPAAESPLASFAGARRLLALESVGNPDNIGGLFRVAAAFGAGGLLLDAASGDPFYRKAIRTSMGATLRLPFARLSSWPGDLEVLRDRGFAVVALTPDRSATPIGAYTATLPADQRLILMLGAEGEGLTPDAIAAADVSVCIPIASGVDSLNVVVAAGIALALLRDPSA
jgi:tRNA G18 (ribose-2'-O)-methylase SpoU